MTTLIISKTDDGIEKRIGTLMFDKSNNATLTTEGSGPEAERLRRVWQETAKRESLPMQRTERKKVNGDTVTETRSYTIPKTDERFPAAVWSYLELEHGYLVDKEH